MSERRALAARPPRGTLLARWPQAAASGLWGLLFTTPSGRPRGCSAPLPRAPPAAWVPPQRPGTCQANPWAAGVRGLGPRVSLCPTAPRCGGLCQAASEPAGCGWKCRPAGCSGPSPGERPAGDKGGASTPPLRPHGLQAPVQSLSCKLLSRLPCPRTGPPWTPQGHISCPLHVGARGTPGLVSTQLSSAPRSQRKPQRAGSMTLSDPPEGQAGQAGPSS